MTKNYFRQGNVNIAAAVFGAGLLATTLQAGEFPDVTTTDGQTYDHIISQRVEPDGLYIEYAPGGSGVGSAKVKFTRLPAALRWQYGYNADAAQQFAAGNATANQDFVAWEANQDAIRQNAQAAAAAENFAYQQVVAQQMAAMSVTPQSTVGHATYSFGFWGSTGTVAQHGNSRLSGTTYNGTMPGGTLFTPVSFEPKNQTFTRAGNRALGR